MAMITFEQAETALRIVKKGETKNLELLEEEMELKDGIATINNANISEEDLKKIAKDKHSIYSIEETNKKSVRNEPEENKLEIQKLAFFDKKMYKLVYDNGVTIEINGIRMHQTKNASPIEDAERKIEKLKIRNQFKVLDICTGLGYSAIKMAEKGANVTTIEADENVLTLAKLNPFSKKLFELEAQGKIQIIVGDAFEEVAKLRDKEFDAIHCDPPFYNFAPALYSKEFTNTLAQKLRQNGMLFFYCGNKESKSAGKVFKTLQSNLKEKFDCKYLENEKGILCQKR